MDGRWGRPDDWLHELENSCGRESCCGIPGLNAELGTEFGCNYGVGSNNCESDVAALNAKFGTSLRCNTNNFNVEGCNPAALELLNFYGTLSPTTSTSPSREPILNPINIISQPPSTGPTKILSIKPTPNDSVHPSVVHSIEPSVIGICTPPGSNCFIKHKGKGCDDKLCEDEICAADLKCCLKKWKKRCIKKGMRLCLPCSCSENSEDIFLLRVKKLIPKTKSCGWLKEQKEKSRKKLCKGFSSFEDYRAARFVCPLTCMVISCNI